MVKTRNDVHEDSEVPKDSKVTKDSKVKKESNATKDGRVTKSVAAKKGQDSASNVVKRLKEYFAAEAAKEQSSTISKSDLTAEIVDPFEYTFEYMSETFIPTVVLSGEIQMWWDHTREHAAYKTIDVKENLMELEHLALFLICNLLRLMSGKAEAALQTLFEIVMDRCEVADYKALVKHPDHKVRLDDIKNAILVCNKTEMRDLRPLFNKGHMLEKREDVNPLNGNGTFEDALNDVEEGINTAAASGNGSVSRDNGMFASRLRLPWAPGAGKSSSTADSDRTESGARGGQPGATAAAAPDSGTSTTPSTTADDTPAPTFTMVLPIGRGRIAPSSIDTSATQATEPRSAAARPKSGRARAPNRTIRE